MIWISKKRLVINWPYSLNNEEVLRLLQISVTQTYIIWEYTLTFVFLKSAWTSQVVYILIPRMEPYGEARCVEPYPYLLGKKAKNLLKFLCKELL